MILVLPYPLSVNHYTGRRGNRTFLTQKARDYIEKVALISAYAIRDYKKEVLEGAEDFNFPIDELCEVEVKCFMPDRRKRDLDNILKVLLDSLQRTGVLKDDSLIDDLRVYRSRNPDGGLKLGGCVEVKIIKKK